MRYPRIQDMRIDADLSQKELGEILHISQRTYSHYETGSRNIPVEMLIRLANYYNTSMDYLVGRTDSKKSSFCRFFTLPLLFFVLPIERSSLYWQAHIH